MREGASLAQVSRVRARHGSRPPPTQRCPHPQAYFGAYLALYYKSDEEVTADEELQAWWRDVKASGPRGRMPHWAPAERARP